MIELISTDYRYSEYSLRGRISVELNGFLVDVNGRGVVLVLVHVLVSLVVEVWTGVSVGTN